LKIGVLGPEGTYSEKAALCWSKGKPDATLVYFSGFEEILTAVEAGELDIGVVPVENSLEGAVPQVMDSLRKLEVVITGEVNLSIRHCLLGAAMVRSKSCSPILRPWRNVGSTCESIIPKRRSEPPAPPAMPPSWLVSFGDGGHR